jgi:multisubunit Na+/H+ antiporter MnhG subunit
LTDQERTHAAAVESIFGAVMLLGGIILITVGGFAGTVGLVLIIVGAAGAAHAVLLGLGLVDLPSERKDRREKHDDLRRRRR